VRRRGFKRLPTARYHNDRLLSGGEFRTVDVRFGPETALDVVSAFGFGFDRRISMAWKGAGMTWGNGRSRRLPRGLSTSFRYAGKSAIDKRESGSVAGKSCIDDPESVVARKKRYAIRGSFWIVAGKSCTDDSESCNDVGKSCNDAELDVHRYRFLHRCGNTCSDEQAVGDRRSYFLIGAAFGAMRAVRAAKPESAPALAASHSWCRNFIHPRC
jgi:hypothetical protein